MFRELNAEIDFWVNDSVTTCLLVRNNVVAKPRRVAMAAKESTDISVLLIVQVVALVARSIGY